MDTKQWISKDGKTTCDDLVKDGYCKDGKPIDKDSNGYQLGKEFNYPEINCCACGAGSLQDAEESFIGGTCTHQQSSPDNWAVNNCKLFSKFGCDEL